MILLDSHALVWWLSRPAALSPRARRAIQGALKQGPIRASAISVLEIATAVRRGRLDLGASMEQWLPKVQALPELQLESVTAEIAALAGSLGQAVHGDPVDRLILATARALGLGLVTADARLQRSNEVQAIW